MSNSTEKTRRLVGLSIFTALVIVLQLVATFVKIGTFPVTLTLVPIVVGAALYGPKAGAWLGFVFGVVVLIACITNAEGYLPRSFRKNGDLLVCEYCEERTLLG